MTRKINIDIIKTIKNYERSLNMNNIHYIKRLIDNRIVSKLNISKSFLKDNSNIANNSIEYEIWVKDSF